MNIERSGWRDQEISLRHRQWGQNCPAVDLDFLLCEYNYGVPIALIDYKHHTAILSNTNGATNRALSGLYNARGENLPFFIVRYWPDTWAFEINARNQPAADALANSWPLMTEQLFVRFLFHLRKMTISAIDEAVIQRLNNLMPTQPQPA